MTGVPRFLQNTSLCCRLERLLEINGAQKMERNCGQNIPGGEKVQVNSQIQYRCGKDYNSIVYKVCTQEYYKG